MVDWLLKATMITNFLAIEQNAPIWALTGHVNPLEIGSPGSFDIIFRGSPRHLEELLSQSGVIVEELAQDIGQSFVTVEVHGLFLSARYLLQFAIQFDG